MKQAIKMILQKTVYPFVYVVMRLFVRQNLSLVVFADAHHNELPYSMQEMYRSISQHGYEVKIHCFDYSHEGYVKAFFHSLQFLRLYAAARFVFICDSFLPASSCTKRPGTALIQLHHSCGACKKMGFDAPDDIPAVYKGNPYDKYDLFTVSSENLIPFYESALRLKSDVIKALGVSRTDRYFSPMFAEACKKRLEERIGERFSDHSMKKKVLWAPTFRRNAGRPERICPDFPEMLQKALGNEWIVLVKVHPHVDAYRRSQNLPPLSNIDLPTEELLPAIDVLVSDYSSVINEAMFFKLPTVLFAPDLEEYRRQRGFYVPYESLSPYLTEKDCEAAGLVLRAYKERSSSETEAMLEHNREWHLGACDGHSTERIIRYIEEYL